MLQLLELLAKQVFISMLQNVFYQEFFEYILSMNLYKTLTKADFQPLV